MYTSRYNVEVYIGKKQFKSYSYAIIRVSLGHQDPEKTDLMVGFFSPEFTRAKVAPGGHTMILHS